jgi:hypothetical protein
MECSHSDTNLINFLQEQLGISNSEIAVVLRNHELDSSFLPMILWQYGLVSIKQLARIFDWLEDQDKLIFDSRF